MFRHFLLGIFARQFCSAFSDRQFCSAFVSARVYQGSAKLNLLLVAQLFNARPRIRELSPHEVKLLVEAAESTGNAEMVRD